MAPSGIGLADTMSFDVHLCTAVGIVVITDDRAICTRRSRIIRALSFDQPRVQVCICVYYDSKLTRWRP